MEDEEMILDDAACIAVCFSLSLSLHLSYMHDLFIPRRLAACRSPQSSQ